MSKRQQGALWVTTILLAALFLVPPWQFTAKHQDGHQLVVNAGYAMVFTPPQLPPEPPKNPDGTIPVDTLYFAGMRRDLWATEIDWLRLLVPGGVVLAFGIVAFFTLRKEVA